TAVAFVVIDAHAVPDFLIYGEGIEAAVQALEPRLDDAVAASCGVVLGSNTCLGEHERTITQHARTLALAQSKPVIVDVNLRLGRWHDEMEARDVVQSLCRDAFLVKASQDEARLLTGEEDPAAAAAAICATLDVRLAVVTLGADGALMRGEASADAPGVPAEVVDTTGAGDAVTGVLAAALAQSGFDPREAARALGIAVGVASRSTESYGAAALHSTPIEFPLAAAGTA
ncbi:MAG: PfkB family carbohydrate kinase, partial [Actinomycetota bacterium]